MKNPVERCGRDVSEDQEGEDGEVHWTTAQGHRCVTLRKMRSSSSMAMASLKAVCGMQITNAGPASLASFDWL